MSNPTELSPDSNEISFVLPLKTQESSLIPPEIEYKTAYRPDIQLSQKLQKEIVLVGSAVDWPSIPESPEHFRIVQYEIAQLEPAYLQDKTHPRPKLDPATRLHSVKFTRPQLEAH
jgi:hypothetical protein